MTPGAAGTARDGYKVDAPHTCPAGPGDPGRRPCPCHTPTAALADQSTIDEEDDR